MRKGERERGEKREGERGREREREGEKGKGRERERERQEEDERDCGRGRLCLHTICVRERETVRTGESESKRRGMESGGRGVGERDAWDEEMDGDSATGRVRVSQDIGRVRVSQDKRNTTQKQHHAREYE